MATTTTTTTTTSRWHDGSRIWLRAVLILSLFVDTCAAFMQQQPVWGREHDNLIRRSKSSLEYTSPPSPFDTIVKAPTSSSSPKIHIRTAPLPTDHSKEDVLEEFPWKDDKGADVTLIPMSTEPLMFWSSKPLLTPDECQVLADYFFQASEYNQQQLQQEEEEEDKDSPRRRDSISDDVAKPILQRVWKHIDRLTFSPCHIGESSRPNYLLYSPEKEPTHDHQSKKDNRWLIPNGLHVDTNNGKLFRHLTILLYLTTPHDTKGGATSFPLAKPIVSNHVSNNDNHDDDNDDKDQDYENTLLQAADALVRTKLHHTQFSKNEQMKHYGNILEHAAVNVFHRDEQHEHGNASPSLGLRVLPKAGHICVFSNLLDSGECDPRSFHGAEQLFQFPSNDESPVDALSAITNEALMGSNSLSSNSNKEVLTFFKEIPLQQFSNHQEFAQRVADSRRQLQQRYLH